MAEPPDDLYGFKEETPAPVPTPAAKNPLPKPALNYRPATAHKSDPEEIKNFYMPIWLLAGGLLVEVIAAILREQDFQAAMIYVAIEVVFGTVVMLAGIMIAAKLRQIKLGKFWSAVFKLSAISVAPAAVATILTPALHFLPALPLGSFIKFSLGGLVVLGVEFLLYFALLGVLFDLDESDTWYCVWAIFLVHLAIYFLSLWAGLIHH